MLASFDKPVQSIFPYAPGNVRKILILDFRIWVYEIRDCEFGFSNLNYLRTIEFAGDALVGIRHLQLVDEKLNIQPLNREIVDLRGLFQCVHTTCAIMSEGGREEGKIRGGVKESSDDNKREEERRKGEQKERG